MSDEIKRAVDRVRTIRLSPPGAEMLNALLAAYGVKPTAYLNAKYKADQDRIVEAYLKEHP